MDIYCKDGKCPICKREVKEVIYDEFTCKNGCYHLWYRHDGKVSSIHMFDTRDDNDWFPTNNDGKIEREDELIKRIDYWKENYRYIAEILMRS